MFSLLFDLLLKAERKRVSFPVPTVAAFAFVYFLVRDITTHTPLNKLGHSYM